MPIKILQYPTERTNAPGATTISGAKGDPGAVGVYQFNALLLNDATIPAGTTAVTVTINPTFYLTAGQSVKGSLFGIDGTLARALDGTYSFTRTTAGSATTVTASSIFVPTQSVSTTLNVGTVAALMAAPIPAVDNLRFKVWGYYAPFEANVRLKNYQWVATSTATHNGGTVIKPTALDAGTAGRYIAEGDEFCPTDFGARLGGTFDCTAAIQACYDNCKKIRYTHGTYRQDGEVTLTIANGSYEDVVVNFGTARIQYNGSAIAQTFIRLPSGNQYGRVTITGGTIVGNLNALGAIKGQDFNQAIIRDVCGYLFPNANAKTFQLYNVNTWTENVHFLNNRAVESNVGLYCEGTVVSGNDRTSFSRFYLDKFFTTNVTWATWFNNCAPYHGYIGQIVGNEKNNIKAFVRLSGGCTNLVIEDCGCEQAYKRSIGSGTNYPNCSAVRGSATLTISGSTFPTDGSLEGKAIEIPLAAGVDPLTGLPGTLRTKVLSVDPSGTSLTLARHVTPAVTNQTAVVYTNGVCFVDSSNKKRLKAPSNGTFTSDDLGWFAHVTNGNVLGGDAHSLITNVDPNGAYIDLNEELVVGAGYNVSIGSIAVYQEPTPDGVTVPTPTMRNLAMLGAAAGDTYYRKGSNIYMGTSQPDLQYVTMATPTSFAPSQFQNEIANFGQFAFTNAAFAYLAVGRTVTTGKSIGGFGAVHLLNAGTDPDSISASGKVIPGFLDFRRGTASDAGRWALQTSKAGVLRDTLVGDEDGIITISNSGYQFGKQITDGTAIDASLQYVILLMPLTNGNTMTGRVYGTKGIGTNANVAGIDYRVNAATGNSPTLTANGSNNGFGQLNAGLVTCTYSGVSYLGIKLGGTANKGLNAPIYFQGVVKNPDANSLTIVAASGVTALTDYTPAAATGTSVYYGSSVPVGPAQGAVWFEQDSNGALVEVWSYDGTDWVSGQKIGNLYTANAAISATYSNTHAPVVMRGSKLLVDSFIISGQLAAAGTIDVSNDWAFTLNRILASNGSKSQVANVLVSSNASAFSSTGPIAPVTTAVGTKYVASGTGAITGLTLSITKTGAPQNLQDVAAQVVYRVCR